MLTEAIQKKPSRGVLRKRCSENIQQIYRRIPIPKSDFNKIAKQSNHTWNHTRHGCSPVNLQHIFRTPFPRNTHLGDCFWLLLEMNIKFYAIPTELWWYYWDLVVKGGENSFVDLFLNISVTIRLRYKSHIEWILQTDNGSFCLFP